MRILQVYKTYYPDTFGGVEQVIYQLSRGLPRLGAECTVLTLTPGKSSDSWLDGHRVVRAHRNLNLASTGMSLSYFRQFAEQVRQCDLVHYHFPWPWMDVGHFACGIDKPTVLTYHLDIVKQKLLLPLYRPLMQRFLARMDRIVTDSPNYLATSPVLQKYQNKSLAIPIGMGPDACPAPSDTKLDEWRRRIGDKFFLFVGVIRYYKGLHILLDAVTGTDFPVVILGAGPEEARLRQMARERGLTQVVFLGALPDEDKAALLRLCYAFVFPSHLRSEAFGISLLEAAMHGKPMVSCEIGTGTSYINQDGVTGLVVPPEDGPAFRAAMTRLWENPEDAQTMGERARAWYEQNFTAEKMVSSYYSVYREVLENTGQRKNQISRRLPRS